MQIGKEPRFNNQQMTIFEQRYKDARAYQDFLNKHDLDYLWNTLSDTNML